MIRRGRVQNGVIVPEEGSQLPKGTVVRIVPEGTRVPSDAAEVMPEAEKERIRSTLDRIASLPMEGPQDEFSGVDHDQVLYENS